MKRPARLRLILPLTLLLSSPYALAQPEPGLLERFGEFVSPVTDTVAGWLGLDDADNSSDTPAAVQGKGKPRGDSQIRKAVRPVRECVKPGGLIDDEVQMCVNGTLEKYW